jgi:hypothetical protein
MAPKQHETESTNLPTDGASSGLSRRGFLRTAAVAGIAAGTAPLGTARAAPVDGTPEQIHLTWGNDPASSVVVSWASPAAAVSPRVHFGRSPGWMQHTAHAVQKTYTDGLNGQTVFNYHARLEGLPPDTQIHYAVTADNDSNRNSPFSASFRTAPRGRARFRFTSYGDLATPVTSWVLSYGQSKFAVEAVNRFEPLFHLLNGDLCYANLNPAAQPSVWADFGNNNQVSAAFRPWMPCVGNHEIEFDNGAQGFESYLSRYTLPGNGTAFPGRWYSFRVGSVLFISLSADDVIYQDGGAFVGGPKPLQPARVTGNPAIEPGTSFYIHGYSGGGQTRWLEHTLREAREDEGIDWIVVQMHQDALSSSKTGNGSDRGLREEWLPLFDRHGVDLVVCGHDHDYERSFPVNGANLGAGRDVTTGAPVETLQPRPVITSDPPDLTFDTRHGTIHLILGGGGTSAPLDVYGVDAGNGLPQAKIFTKPNRPIPGATPGTFVRLPADAIEDAIWSAKRDTGTGYGIAVFDVDPGPRHGKTSITIRYFHPPGPTRRRPRTTSSSRQSSWRSPGAGATTTTATTDGRRQNGP